jgi:hypothetical protein
LPYAQVNCYDINSTYPAAMKCGVPVGQILNTIKYREDKPGFYKIIATCPHDFIMPVLALRDGVDLSFPTGTFETYASSIEIDYARSLGYHIEIEEGYFFEGLASIFDAYVQKCESLRARFKGTPTEFVIKQMQNSVYGRFGLRPEGAELMIDYSGEVPEGWCLYVVSDQNDEAQIVPNLFMKEKEREAEYMMPHWAAWITANARILLDRGCRATGIHKVLYRDTDSAYIAGDAAALDVGPGYGQWKHEGTFTDFRTWAPKYYSYRNGEGELVVKCKAIPKKKLQNLELREQLHRGELPEVDYHSSNGVITFLKTGAYGCERKRHPTAAEKVYGHYINEAGKFRPRRASP